MSVKDRWPLPLPAVIGYLRESLGYDAGQVAWATPGDLEERLPFVRVQQGPGGDDGVTATVELDVDVFGDDPDDVFSRAEDVRGAMLDLSAEVAGGILFDRVTTVQGPMQMEWPNPQIIRLAYTFRTEFRQQTYGQ